MTISEKIPIFNVKSLKDVNNRVFSWGAATKNKDQPHCCILEVIHITKTLFDKVYDNVHD